MKTEFNKNWLNNILKEHNLSIPAFMKRIGKPRPTIDRWINGSKPHPDMICLLIDEFNLEPNYFFIQNLPTEVN